jgi:beta-lactam-binding protein with PASTA domain
MSWRSHVRTSLVYLVSIVAGFALAYLVVAFVVFPAGVVPRDVKVPNVTGLMYDEAEQRLAQAGFKAERGEQRYNNSAPKMTVLEQTPPPGAREGLGNTVTLAVSGGQRMVAVPTVTGMTQGDAQAILEKNGFDVGEVSEQQSNSPRGTVIATRPAAGSQVSVPSTVGLVMSSGAASIMMPDLMGRDIVDARQLLLQLGAKNVQVDRDPNGVGAVGAVISQSPVANTPFLPNSAVRLKIVGAQPQ